MKRGVKEVNTVLGRELAEKATLLLVGICDVNYHIQVIHQYESDYLVKVYDLAYQEITELEVDTNQLSYLESGLWIEFNNYLIGVFVKVRKLFNPLLRELILESLYQVLSYAKSLDEDRIMNRIQQRLTQRFQVEIHHYSKTIEG